MKDIVVYGNGSSFQLVVVWKGLDSGYSGYTKEENRRLKIDDGGDKDISGWELSSNTMMIADVYMAYDS